MRKQAGENGKMKDSSAVKTLAWFRRAKNSWQRKKRTRRETYG